VPKPPDPAKREPPRDKLELSPAQILASAVAAVTAAIVCSVFGVGGTVVGTAIASAVATTASALYAHSLRVTRHRIRALQRQRLRLGPHAHAPISAVEAPGGAAVAPPPAALTVRRLSRSKVAIAALVVFVLSIDVVTTIETGIGKPFADLLRGSRHHRETSLGGLLHTGPTKKPSAPPSPTPTATPSPTVSPTPSASPSPSPIASPSPTPSTSRRPQPLISLVP
jgi:hypothetical protein